jgi:hypothetical protein
MCESVTAMLVVLLRLLWIICGFYWDSYGACYFCETHVPSVFLHSWWCWWSLYSVHWVDCWHVSLLPCLQIWLCRILGALSLVLSFQNKEVNIICYSEPVKCCRSQTNIKYMCFVYDWFVKTDFSQYCSRFGYSRIYSLIMQKVKVGDGMNNSCSRASWNPFFRNY